MKSFSGELSFEVEMGDVYGFTLFFNTEELDRIKLLQQKVKELAVYEITDFDGCGIEVRSEDTIDEDPQRLDVVILHVQEEFIRVTGVIKHDNHTFSTGLISLNDLEEII